VDFDMKCDDERKQNFPTTTLPLIPPGPPTNDPYLIVQIGNSSIPRMIPMFYYYVVNDVDYYYNYSAVSSQEFLYIRFVENTT
jgi:hypothetical protein